MPVDYINDDGTFAEGFETNFDAEVRDYAKGFKDINALVKSGLEARREFRDRVKLPDDPKEKEAFVDQHFKDVLEARNKTREEQATAQAEEAKTAAETARAEALTKSTELAKEILGTDADMNIELCRRAFRSDFCPNWIKDGIAKVAGVEVKDLTDAQFKEILVTDPAVVETLLKFGTLTKDGTLPRGDNPTNKANVEEVEPGYPYQPQYYQGRPDSDPEKAWFINRGAKYDGGKYDGGYQAVPAVA